MDKALLIGIAAALYFLYRRNSQPSIPESWMAISDDYWYILPVGTLPFEDAVMQYKVAIMKAGQDNAIEAAIIAAIIGKESKGQANVVNGRFNGLMQLGLAEASAMGYGGNSAGLLNPDTNITYGAKYLRYCINHKNGDLPFGISGYNTGNVERENTPYNALYVDEVASYVPRFRYLLSQSFPGYGTVFPKENWLKTVTVT
jgi:soluble lytic murein transglycosylase-like protein